MAYEQRDNSGRVFKNERKEKDTHPDRTGTAMIDGVAYYVSGWIKQGRNGQFLSLAFKRKDDQPQRDASSISQRAQETIRRPDPISSGLPRDDMKDERTIWNGPPRDDMNDEIPF